MVTCTITPCRAAVRLNSGVRRQTHPMLPKFYKANVAAASAHALASLAICSSYELWQPHAVGHLYPAASATVSAAWGVHCRFLGVAARESGNSSASLRLASIPIAIALVAGIACWVRYDYELARQYKMFEYI